MKAGLRPPAEVVAESVAGAAPVVAGPVRPAEARTVSAAYVHLDRDCRLRCPLALHTLFARAQYTVGGRFQHGSAVFGPILQ